MKYFKIASLGLLLTLAACHSTKKIVSTNTSKPKDTTIVQKPTSVKDSATLAKEILTKVLANAAHYKTISGKLGVSVKATNLDQNFTANLRGTKDSLVWISLTGPFGIEGARAKISTDSAIVINKLNSTVEKRSISFIQNIIHQPLSLVDIQNILTGGMLLREGTIQSFKGNTDGTWIIVLKQGNIQNTVTIDPNKNRVLNNSLKDITVTSRNCIVQYKSFQDTDAGWIPTEINISAQDKSPIKVELNYKQFNFNQTLDYPFNIPSKYRVVQ